MTSNQRLPTSLTPLDVALGSLLRGVEPVASRELPLAEALRCIAAEMPPLGALPPNDIAASDGFALRARDLAGASSYTPLPLASSPVWVEAGDQMPEGCDCVLDADSVDQTGPIAQVLAEAIPGQGVRRAGGDIAEGTLIAEAGRRVLPRDLLIARAAGVEKINVRRPRLRIINIPGGAITANLIAESAAPSTASTNPALDAGSRSLTSRRSPVAIFQIFAQFLFVMVNIALALANRPSVAIHILPVLRMRHRKHHQRTERAGNQCEYQSFHKIHLLSGSNLYPGTCGAR